MFLLDVESLSFSNRTIMLITLHILYYKYSTLFYVQYLTNLINDYLSNLKCLILSVETLKLRMSNLCYFVFLSFEVLSYKICI